MPDPLPAPPVLRPRREILFWAVGATLAAILFASLSLVLWMQLRSTRRETARAQATATRPNSSPKIYSRPLTPSGTNGFATLQDSDVAGRYRFFEDGNEVGTIILLPNHSMINKDGTTFRQYHWEIRPDGILTTWQRTDLLFDRIEKPGVYVASRNGKESRRIEKLAE